MAMVVSIGCYKGKEVANFVKAHFAEEFIKLSEGKPIDKTLIGAFLKMDQLLVEPEGKEELRVASRKGREEDDQGSPKQDRQVELFKSLFDPRCMEDCDIASFTGCTACVCCIEGNNIYFANAGDSRAIIAYNGIACEMTIDHKPELESEKERIYKADGWISEGRVRGNLNLTRSIGDLEYKTNKRLTAQQQIITSYPDITKRDLKEVDFIVIACDGVWDCKSSQEVVDYIYKRIDKQNKLSSIVEELFDEILASDVYNSIMILINRYRSRL
jgi:protein phosphatase 1G